MIYILKDIGKGKIGLGERQISTTNLFRLDSDHSIDTNYFVNSAVFDEGIITLTRNDGETIKIPMDGRYLKSFTEQDPTVPQHVKDITLNNITNWNNGSADSITSLQLTRSGQDLVVTLFKRSGESITQQIKLFVNSLTDIPNRSYNDLQDLPTLKLSNWNDAYSWGDHNQMGYITGINSLLEIPNRSYNDLQDLPDINANVTVVNKNLSFDKHVIASVASVDILETVTRLNEPTINGNILTLKFINENDVEQAVSVDLSGIVSNTSGLTNATYDAATNIITLIEEDGDVYTIDLSEFSIITNTNEHGVTTLTQEDSIKLTVSKVGQSGTWLDILNKPTTLEGYNITNVYDKLDIDNFFKGISLIDGYNKVNWDETYVWGNHATAGYLTEYQNLVWDVTLGNLSLTNGNTINLDGRYARTANLTPLATTGLSIQDSLGNEKFLSTESLKFHNVIFDTDSHTISIPSAAPQTLSWNGYVNGKITISDGNTIDLDERYGGVNPTGAEGQQPFISDSGSNKVELDFPMKRGIVVETEEELIEAQAEGFSMGEVFNRWSLFSHHYGDDPQEQSPVVFPAFNEFGGASTRLTPQEFYDKSAWGYDPTNDRIYLTKNYDPYTGFISPKKYSNFNLEVTLSSINNDVDQIGVVVAFYKDPDTGFEYTLSVIRALTQLNNQYGQSYEVVFNYAQNPNTSPYYNPAYASSSQKTIISKSTAAPVPSGSTGWVGNDTRIRVERVNDIFQIKTSQFGSTNIDNTTLITIDLNNYPELLRFKGGSEIGFSARSQKDAYFSDISFTGFVDYIFYPKSDDSYDIYEFDPTSETYFLQFPKTMSAKEHFGVSRFVHSHLFGKTYYINENDTFIKVGGGGPSIEEFIAHIEDYENPHNVTPELIGLGNVDNTADIDKEISIPQREEFDRVEELIPINTSQLINDSGFITQSDTFQFFGSIGSQDDIVTIADTKTLVGQSGYWIVLINETNHPSGLSSNFKYSDEPTPTYRYLILLTDDNNVGAELKIYDYSGNIWLNTKNTSWNGWIKNSALDGSQLVAANISQEDIDNWNQSFQWGNHADAGYALQSDVDNLVEDKYYPHEQSLPSTEWLINHELNKRPSVFIVDGQGNNILGEIQYVDLNTVKVLFSVPISGRAELN